MIKKTLVIVFVSLLAVLCWGKSAYANTIVVQNKTDRVIVVDVTYPGMFCRNDNNIWIAPGKHWSVGAGSCAVESVNANIAATVVTSTVTRNLHLKAAYWEAERNDLRCRCAVGYKRSEWPPG